MTAAKKLRELFARNRLVIAPGAHDALTARVIEKCAFEAVYMTGYGQAASHLGTNEQAHPLLARWLRTHNALIPQARVESEDHV